MAGWTSLGTLLDRSCARTLPGWTATFATSLQAAAVEVARVRGGDVDRPSWRGRRLRTGFIAVFAGCGTTLDRGLAGGTRVDLKRGYAAWIRAFNEKESFASALACRRLVGDAKEAKRQAKVLAELEAEAFAAAKEEAAREEFLSGAAGGGAEAEEGGCRRTASARRDTARGRWVAGARRRRPSPRARLLPRGGGLRPCEERRRRSRAAGRATDAAPHLAARRAAEARGRARQVRRARSSAACSRPRTAAGPAASRRTRRRTSEPRARRRGRAAPPMAWVVGPIEL